MLTWLISYEKIQIYINKINTLTPPPDLYVILHFIQLIVDKYDAG